MVGVTAYTVADISPTQSVGKVNRGQLENGEVIPRTGAGFSLLNQTRQRKNRFGTHELVRLVQTTTFRVKQKMGGQKLHVGDLSARRGGKIENHASHQNGRDVDLGFYALDKKGRSVTLSDFIQFDKNGYSIVPAMTYRFDTRRNFELVRQLLLYNKPGVQWIFVANHIEALLVEEAGRRGMSKAFISRMQQVLNEPAKNAHLDHFHVRIYCANDDQPRCVDFGPRWRWLAH